MVLNLIYMVLFIWIINYCMYDMFFIVNILYVFVIVIEYKCIDKM